MPPHTAPPEVSLSPRGSRWPRWGAASLAAALLLGGACVWLQTEAAFQRVWLPLAARSLGGEWTAAAGRLSIAGSLEVETLRVESPALRGGVDRIALRLRPLASLRAGRPVVETLEAEGARLMVSDTEGAAPEADEAADASPDDDASPALDVEIERARLTGIEIEIAEGENALAIGPLSVELDDWVPFETGHAKLEAPVTRRIAGEPDQRLRLVAELLVQPVESSPNPREPTSFALDARLDVEPVASLGVGAVVASIDADGFFAPGGAGVRVREARLDLAEDGVRRLALGSTGELVPDLDVELQVEVDPLEGTSRFGLLSELAGLLDGAQVRGRVQLSDDSDGWRVKPDLRLGPLASATRSAEPDGPPLAVAMTGGLRWQAESGAFYLEPLTVDRLGGADEALGRLELRGLLRDAASDLRAEATDLDLLPWLDAFGLRLADARHRLGVSGKLSFRREEQDALDGELALSLGAVDESGRAAGDALAAMTCIPELRGTVTGLGGTIALHRRGGAEGAPEPLALLVTLVPPKGDEPAAARILLDVADLDLTPWAPLWEARADAPASAEGGDAVAAVAPEPAQAPEGPGIDVQAKVGRLSLRELAVTGGEIGLRFAPRRLGLDVAGLGLAGGLVDAEVRREERGAGTELDWTLRASEIDLRVLLASLSTDGTAALHGILGLDSTGRGSGATLESALDAAAGDIGITLQEGRAEGLAAQQEIAAETGMPEFQLIDFGTIDVVYAIEGGRIFVDGLPMDGKAVHLVTTGSVGWRGVDLAVNPRIGPDLRGAVPGRFAQSLVGTVTGTLALPLIVRVEGDYGAIGVGVEPAAPAVLGDLYSGVTGLVDLVPGGAPPAP